MKERLPVSEAFERLRQRAERLLQDKGTDTADMEKDDLVRLTHELEVYHVELELQNEELRRSNAEVETSREEYFDLFDSSPVAYVILDEKGIVERANQAASRMLGVERLSPQLFLTWVSSEDMLDYQSFIERLIMDRETRPVELRLRSRNGPIHVQMQGVVKSEDNMAKHWRLALVDITERMRMEKELRNARDELELRVKERTAQLEERAEQLSRLSMELTLAEQRERSRIAKVLHDHLQQLLVAARINLEILMGEIGNGSKETAERVLDLIVQSIQEMRFLNAQLEPPVLNSGDLSSSLGWLVRWMRENQNFDVKIDSEAPIVLDRKDLAALVFQAIRELLFNVSKHAGVKTAEVKLGYQNGNLQVVISDQGKGFVPELAWADAESRGKFGLITIRERVRHLGGSLDIQSAPGAGTVVSLVLPLGERRLKVRAPDVHTETQGRPGSAPAGMKRKRGKIRLMLVDDHPVMREGLSRMLDSHADMEVIGEASDGEEAVRMAQKLIPDVILMDIRMPKMDGLEATRIIHAEFPHIRIVGLSMYDEDDQAEAMLDAGASAYRSKSGSTDRLLAAIRRSEAPNDHS